MHSKFARIMSFVLVFTIFSQLLNIVAQAEKSEYSFLQEMTVAQLKKLDEEIHNILLQESSIDEFDDSDIALKPGTFIVHRTDGEREVCTLTELLRNMELNSVKYGKLYTGATVLFVGYVEKMDYNVSWNFHKMPIGFIMMDEKKDGNINYRKYAVVEISDEDDCMYFDVGDCVLITGKIDSFFSNSCVQIYMTDSDKTVIKPFDLK